MSTAASQASNRGTSSQGPNDENDICLTPPRGGGSRSNNPSASSSWAPQEGSASRHTTERTSNTSPPQQKEESFQDKLGNAAAATGSGAVMGLLELLKVAGGVTLSTTGKIVAPPLHVTRTILLPSLWAATKDYLSINTPQRVKDWFRILSSSLYHIQSVLIATERGKELQEKLKTVGVDVVDVASSDSSRQAFMDGMACVVRLSEALHTPETRALLDQLSILGCRLVDVASTGRTKQLLHDASDCVWSAIELSADPATTLALAEVTAYLCHALEMENALRRPLDRNADEQKRAQRRRDRNRFERETYIDPHMLQEPNVTVEQAILSSIGGPTTSSSNVGGGGDACSLPSNVVFDEQQQEPPESPGGMGSETHSLKDQEEQQHTLEQHWKEEANNVVNVSLLQEKIAERAAQKEEKAFHRTRPATAIVTTTREEEGETAKQQQQQQYDAENDENDEASDIEDLAQPILDNDDEQVSQQKEDSQDKQSKESRQRPRVDLAMESNEEDNSGSITQDSNMFGLDNEYLIPLRDPLEPRPDLDFSEPATAQFYRTLDEIMTKKRNETVDALLAGQFDDDDDKNQESGSNDPGSSRGRSWYFKAAAAAGAGNERGQDTVKQEVSTIKAALRSRAAIGVGKAEAARNLETAKRPRDRPPSPLEEVFDRYTVLLGLFIGFLAVVAMIWFGFGCYGLYIYIYGHSESGGMTEFQATPGAPAAQEIVVRIVREVVHMTPNGEVIESVVDNDASLVDHADDIAACVANAIK